VIPIGADREVKVDREALRASLQRAAILSNEKYRGIRVEVSPGNLKISAHNPEQEEAQEEIEADTTVSDLAIGFNVNYLLDALRAAMRKSSSSCATQLLALVRESSSEKSRHVVMPLRL
jgi:DNA polymerase-3 subunit beta